MICNRVTAFLDDHDVAYEVVEHRVDYTAQETAADTHTPGRDFAKTVVLETPGGHAMAVIPALHKVDLEKIRRGIGTGHVKLSAEETVARVCPDCEVGAEPPFGNLYDLPVYVDPTLTTDEFITFNGGTHEEAIRMRFSDWERCVHPTIMDMVIDA